MSRTLGLIEAVELVNGFDRDSKQSIDVPHGFTLPSFWVAVAAFAKEQGLSSDQIILPNDDGLRGYASAMGFEAALWGKDNYAHMRKNAGRAYSPLTLLTCQEDTDTANECIANCIRSMFSQKGLSGVSELCSVVGDLHDNVWSHGMATGFSMAQKYCGTRIRFALADHGKGFFREMKDAGLDPADDREAIEWCIVEGNSTKLPKEDDWEQKLPADAIHNPYGSGVHVRTKDNNHQGIGLSKLVSLTQTHGGFLRLVSGTCMLQIANNGAMTYIQGIPLWKGVAISCEFSMDALSKDVQNADDGELEDIVRRLKG